LKKITNGDDRRPSLNQFSSHSHSNTPTDEIHTHYTVVSSRRMLMMCSDVSSMHFVAYFFYTFCLRLEIDPMLNAMLKKELRVLPPTLMAVTPIGAQIPTECGLCFWLV